MTTELKECFSCELKSTTLLPMNGSWDEYKPMIYKDRLLGKWVIECQNCGMEVIFSETEQGSIDLWNDIYRKDNP